MRKYLYAVIIFLALVWACEPVSDRTLQEQWVESRVDLAEIEAGIPTLD